MVRACLCLAIIISGLALRSYGLGAGLPAFIVKYGGSLLWAMMVFFLVAMAAPARSRWSIALISAAIAVCVELFRLVHAPWLDAFRLTTAGALLPGRTFSPWNMLAYGGGDRFGDGAGSPRHAGFQKRKPSALRALIHLSLTRRTLAAMPPLSD